MDCHCQRWLTNHVVCQQSLCFELKMCLSRWYNLKSVKGQKKHLCMLTLLNLSLQEFLGRFCMVWPLGIKRKVHTGINHKFQKDNSTETLKTKSLKKVLYLLRVKGIYSRFHQHVGKDQVLQARGPSWASRLVVIFEGLEEVCVGFLKLTFS